METDGGGWIVFQRRFDGSVRFVGKLWEDFKNGFGNLEGEFWLGNEIVHILSNRKEMELWYEGTSFYGDTRHVKKSGFKLGSEVENYSTMWEGQLRPFTAEDRDNDNAIPFNCAVKYYNSWWHSACFNIAFNGLYSYQETVNNYVGIIWIDFLGSPKKSLKATKMMIR